MTQPWLQTNRRALYFGMFLPLLGAAAGLAIMRHDLPLVGDWSDALGLILIVLCVLTISALAAQTRQPRIAYKTGFLLVYLGTRHPIKLPLQVVECFLLGQGEGMIPVAGGKQVRASNLIMRLADKEADWADRDVKPALGKWHEGYVTMKGTWCEPLDLGVVKRLNRALAEAKREVKGNAGHG